MTLLSDIVAEARAQSLPEIVAVLAAIAYLVLAIRQNILCWFCAAISSAIYVWLLSEARLYMESALHGFYFFMAIYGWVVWKSGRIDSDTRPVVVWPLKTHLAAAASLALLSAVSGYLLSAFGNAVFPYIDSLTTWFAIWATFLVARKVLENWWYWLLINTASVFIYWSRDLQLTSMLFVVYIVMIPFGLVSWTRSMREQRA